MADPEFDWGRGLCQRGRGDRKSLKVLTVEVKVFFKSNKLSAKRAIKIEKM